jgi:hypothetical protein
MPIPDKKGDISEIGGECVNCGEEDKWLIDSRELVEDSDYDYHYDLICQHVFEDGETCGQTKELTQTEEPEYDKEDDPSFFDDDSDITEL